MNLTSSRVVLPLLALAMTGLGYYHVSRESQSAPASSPPEYPAQSPFEDSIAASGVVEARTENIAIGAHVPGVVKAVHVRVDDRITAGTPLFDLDDRHMSAELGVREAMRSSAAAQLAKLEAMPRREELPPLEAKVAEAKASLEDKAKLFERARREVESGVGKLDTIVYTSKRTGGDRLTRTWVAPALGYLPVKGERIRGSKLEFTMTLVSVDR